MKNIVFLNAWVFLIVLNPGEKACFHLKSGRRGREYPDYKGGGGSVTVKGPPKDGDDSEKGFVSVTVADRYRFTKGTTTKKVKSRTPPYRPSVAHQCDYLIMFCSKAYRTGVLCARSLNFHYMAFPNYCTMDFVNCKARFEFYGTDSIDFLKQEVMPEENPFGGDLYEGIG